MMRKGVTPVVATVLLIGIVIVLAATVFIWAQGFITEGIEKRGEPIDRSCADVSFDASISQTDGNYFLDVNNRANVPIYAFDIKLLGSNGDARIRSTSSDGVNIGMSVQIPLTSDKFPELYDSSNPDLIVIPILLGSKKDSRLFYPCPEQYGRGVSSGI